MSKQRFLYLHGYGTAIESFFQRPLPQHRGFWLSENFNQQHSVLPPFDWSIRTKLNWWAALNPCTQFQVYLKYRQAVEDEQVLKKLNSMLKAEQPTTLVCHSLGCQLLLNYLKFFQLPASVNRVIFLQADIPHDQKIDLPKEVTLTNVYCPWDFSLLVSSLYHFKLRAGIFGLNTLKTEKGKSSNHQNVFFPALIWGNPHTAVLRDLGRLEHMLE